MQIDQTTITAYLTGQKQYVCKVESEKDYSELKIHMDGEYPQKLIEERRPSEPEHVKAYRKLIFQHVSMPTVLKVVAALGRIRKSTDWSIQWNENEESPLIAKDETLKTYTEKKFPVFGSVTKWVFDVMLKQYLTDANGVIAVFPKEFSPAPNVYHKPFPYIYNSTEVLAFEEGKLCIVKTTDTVELIHEGGVKTKTDKYIVLTDTSFQIWHKNNQGKFISSFSFDHNFGELPAWKMGGLSKGTKEGSFIWRSRIYPMIPRLNEAVREYSDLQAGVVQHLFLKEWEYESQICGTCKGIGKVTKTEGGSIKCPNKLCKGGILQSSPYEKVIVRPGIPNGAPVPMPPGGYIDRNPEIIKIQDERVDKHEFKALSAVNMEYLAKTPLSESGLAKQTDREETNIFVYGVAEDVVGNTDKVYKFIAMWRYHTLFKGNTEEVLKQLPVIPVPEKYDLFSSDVLMAEIAAARTAKMSSTTISAMEQDYNNKKFSANIDRRDECNLIIKLDPLGGFTPDEKSAMLFNKGITESEFIVSCNINSFVKRALEEDKTFAQKSLVDQRKTLDAYAQDIINKTVETEKRKMELAASFMPPPMS